MPSSLLTFAPRRSVLVVLFALGCQDPVSDPIATQLIFRTQPTSTVAGTALTPALRVELADADGALVAASGIPVTLSLSAGYPAATILGATTVATVSGVATFTDVSLATAGVGFSLEAAAPGLASARSSPFNISASSVATLRVVSGGTQSAIIGRPLADTLRIVATDRFDNPVPGVPLSWSVAGDAGTLLLAEALTDARGVARARWRLGTLTGTHQIVVAAGTISVSISATAAPLRLLAFKGLALSTFAFTTLNAETGLPLATVARPEVTSSIQGYAATDSLSGRYFISNGVLFTLDAATGSLLASTSGGADVNEIQYDPASQAIVGLTTRTGVAELVRVNPTSGQVTSVGFVRNLSGTSQGSAGFDGSTGRYFVVGLDTSSVFRLFTISASTGAVLASPDVSTLDISSPRFDPTSGSIVGLTRRTGEWELVRINTVSGVVSSSGIIPGVNAVLQGEAALDAATGTYVFLASDGSTERAYSVRVLTAAIISQPPAPQLSYLQIAP